jgi:indole-3-glycerol phosphate synthase
VSRLDEILATKRAEIDALNRRGRVRDGARPGTPNHPGPAGRTPIDAVHALRRGPGQPLRLVAEIKLRSPSAGPLSRAMSPGERALAYADGGASMVSVLCDATYFDGAWSHLAEARSRLDAAGLGVPILAKDFVLDPVQIAEARDRGADAVLLIARIVDGPRLAGLARVARAEGLEPLIEVIDERELDAALAAGARIVGVNARDLDTLVMDGERAVRVVAAIPPGVVAVRLSGLRDAGDVASMARGRSDAALIGEALMRDDDPRPRLQAMVDAARSGPERA